MMFMHQGQNSLGLGPRQDQQDQKGLKNQFPKPAAHGLKPPKAKEANKFMILKHNISELAYRFL